MQFSVSVYLSPSSWHTFAFAPSTLTTQLSLSFLIQLRFFSLDEKVFSFDGSIYPSTIYQLIYRVSAIATLSEMNPSFWWIPYSVW